MRIPAGYGYSAEGEHMFVQPGLGKEEYQVYWPFTDTTINVKRRISSPGSEVDSGDILSLQDTYACAGDWLPEEEATFLWVRGYDIAGLGIRVEQRTYSWDYDYNNSYIYVNHKIINMNSFPLRDIYVGYFMDNDVGSGLNDPQGAWDDMIGYDKALDLGYTYDSDGFEPGWKTPAGYVGCAMLETPDDRGMTGFNTWLYGDPIDDDTQDSLKYEALKNTEFKVWTLPRDVRELLSSGPHSLLRPWEQSGDELNFTVAIVVGITLEELKNRTEFALTQFEAGYLGFSPPPSPELTLTPGDRRVHLSWDGTVSEGYRCAFSKQNTFEGYRVYRSLTGLPDEWELLADYDLAGSATSDTVKVQQKKGASKLTAELAGFYGKFDGDTPGPVLNFGDAVYTINFDCPCEVETLYLPDTFVVDVKATVIHVFNKGTGERYEYNRDARVDGSGYCVEDTITGDAYPDTGYVSGACVYIDSFYVMMSDGVFDPEQPGADLTPNEGDIVEISSYKGKDVGAQAGLAYSYIDDDLVNGMTYYYSVTSYSREIPTWGVTSLESGKTAKKYWAIPRKDAADWTGAQVEVHAVTGGDATIEVGIADPEAVTGDDYTITFLADNPLQDSADYWRLEKGDSILLDSLSTVNGERSNPSVDGLSISVETVKKEEVDTTNTKWVYWTGSEPTYYFDVSIRKEAQADYEITIADTTDSRGNWSPLYLTEMREDTILSYFWYRGDTLEPEKKILVYDSTGTSIILDLTVKDSASIDTALISTSPQLGDVYAIRIIKRTTAEDRYTLSTTSLMSKKDEYNLDMVRVVPNPYYIRAPWDKSRFEQQVWFQGLPSVCTIRIFNAAGLLVKTIDHEAEGAGAGASAWNLRTDEGSTVVSGLYIYQVTTPNGKEKVAKFAIIR